MKKPIVSFLILFFSFAVWAQENSLPAFPGAEGGGMYTEGGRGGNVYFVTSLDDTSTGNKETGAGTLRWCLAQAGPRTIVFRVSGIIRLKTALKIPANTTIAGQTAPGDGVCIADNYVQLNGSQIIVRYMRFRMGDLTNIEGDAFWGRRYTNIIIDHCSMSWSTDECASFYDNTNFTLQWSILAESLRSSVHGKGAHGYGGIWGGKTATFHHNLIAHHDSRNPRMCGSRYSNQPELELVDFRNNVIYNWGSNSGYAGEGGSYNFVNNYYKPGIKPDGSFNSSNPSRIFQPYPDDGKNSQPAGVWGKFYVEGNYVVGSTSVTENNWNGIHPNSSTKPKDELKSETEFQVPFVTTQTAEEAYNLVLANVGASYRRDSTDARIVNEVANGLVPVRASNGTTRGGLIDTQTDVGGWDTYSYNVDWVPLDSDNDGMPNDWELKNGLNPNDVSDRNNLAATGYTMLETYLNEMLLTGGTAVDVVPAFDVQLMVYPNVVHDDATIRFYLKENETVKVELIDTMGQIVQTVANQTFDAGMVELPLKPVSLKSGIHLCRVTSANNRHQVVRFIVR